MSRAKEEEQSVTFPLDLGMDNTALPQLVQPVGESAALIMSQNTRLSKTRGIPRKAPGSAACTNGTVLADAPCLGIIPCANMDSSVAFFHNGHGSRRIVGSTVTDLQGTALDGNTNNYVPAQVSRAGGLPGGASYTNASVVYDEVYDCTWVASVRKYNTDTVAIYISALSSSGELLVQPYPAVTCTGTNPGSAFSFVGLTAHGANGAVLWYRDTTDVGAPSNTIKARTLDITALELTLGAANTIYTPVQIAAGQAHVSSDEDGYAYLVTFHSATATTISIHKVTLATWAVSTTDRTTFAISGDEVHLCNCTIDGTGYLLVAVASHANGTNATLYTTSAMTLVWTQAGLRTTTPADEVGCGFHVTPTDTYAFLAITDFQGSTASVASASTRMSWHSMVDGTSGGTHDVGWMRAISKPALLRVADDEIYPLIAAQRQYSWTAVAGDEDYVTDPSIEVLLPSNQVYGTTCIARFAVDSAFRETDQAATFSNSSYCVGNKYFLAYREDVKSKGYLGYPQRYIELDFAAGQPRYTLTPEGTALIAAALPTQWDGVSVTELNPIHRPMISVDDVSGSGATLTAVAGGRYRFAAMHSWKDNAGIVHRSMPSETRTITGASMEAIVTVAMPLTMRDGGSAERYDTIIFQTVEDGTTLYAQSPSVTVSTNFDLFNSISQTTVGASNPPIYTDGDASLPLMSQCPPAAKDIEIVGNRCWLLSAERPNELWVSKEREPYTAYEFSSDLIVRLPAPAGQGVAVVELQGAPIILTNTGIYTVSGQGPDAVGRGSWNPPDRLSSVKCTSTASAISTPVGVMFISGNRFVQFQGQTRLIDGIDASLLGTCTHSVILTETQEVVFFGTLLNYVYNYSLDRWSTWNTNVVPVASCAALVPSTGNVLTYSESAGTLYLLDTDSVSTTAQMLWTTGDLVFGGPQDDNVLSDIIIHGQTGGTHGLTVTLTPDYGQSSAVTKTFSATDIVNATVNSQYSLSCALGTMSCRALKISIQETGASGEGAKPVSVTVLVAKNPGTKRDAIRASGRK